MMILRLYLPSLQRGRFFYHFGLPFHLFSHIVLNKANIIQIW